MMKQTLKLENIPDLINGLPSLLGFAPAESLIVFTFTGEPSILQLCARIDLQHCENADDVIAEVFGPIMRHNPDAFAFLIATSTLPIVAAARADGHTYWEDHHGSVASGDGIPYTQSVSVLVAHEVASGRFLYGSRADMEAAHQPVDNDDARTLSALLEDLPAVDTFKELVDRATLAMERTLSSGFTPAEALWLVIAANIKPVRDTLWQVIAAENAHQYADMWRQVAVHCPPHSSAPAYALAGYANWIAGDGGQARVCVNQSLAADSTLALAGLLADMLDAAVSPVGFREKGTC